MEPTNNEPPNISNVPKKDPNGKPIPQSSDGTLVRIRLFDDRERVLFFPGNPSPTARQVTQMIAEKLDLTPEGAAMFSLWIVSKDIELQIRPKLELREMVEKWPRYFEKYTHRPETDSGTFKFVYRREAMVSIEAESRIFDAAAIKLLYGEARKNIMTGRYPVPDPNEAAKLAAMHLLSTHGTYDPQKHGPGTNFIQESLQLLVPSNVVMKFKPPEWDQRILSAWSNMVKKESDIAGYKDFLDYCMQWTIYGSNFFPACKNVPPEGYFELRTDHLMIGVGRSGICIVDMDKGKVSWYGSYAGVEWECTPDSITIEYRPNTNGNGAAPKRMASTLITPQAHLIDSLASRAVYLIEKSARRPKDRRASTTKGAVIEKSSRMATEDAEAYLKAVNEARKSGM